MNKQIIVRQETPSDYAQLYDFIEVAFQTAQVKDGTEQDFAANLRKSDCYISDLALVAQRDGKIVGHVMSTKTYITEPDGTRFDALMMAPLCVDLECRGEGIGALLIHESFDRARAIGYKAIFLCGDPAYYHRFGFRSIGDFDITHASIPEPYVMGYELVPSALTGVMGVVRVE